MPKKTGIDKITQIEDYDLFEYDREVQPILNVLLSKTVEQAILEVEEESELSDIRKFKTEYRKRREEEQNKWEQEVQREISLIMKKEKELKNARAKREQEIKTMHKLQCINIAKNFLSGCFMGTMKKLAKNNVWRDSFKDQLTVAYKESLLQAVRGDTDKFGRAFCYLDDKVASQLEAFADRKLEIRRQMIDKTSLREMSRLIESNHKRIVHFTFDPKQPVTETPFTQKFCKLIDDSLADFEAQQDEAFDQYCEAIIREEEGDMEYPIKLGPNPFPELALYGISEISFAVADNPFRKSSVCKFYPELHVINGEGKVLQTISPETRSCDKYGNTMYCENFRDEKLKINDDRKIKISEKDFPDQAEMVLLTVRCFDTKKEKSSDDYGKAWWRL